MLADDIEHYKPVLSGNTACEADQSDAPTIGEESESKTTDKKIHVESHNTNGAFQCQMTEYSGDLELSPQKSSGERFTSDIQAENISVSCPSLLDVDSGTSKTPSIMAQAIHDVMHTATPASSECSNNTNMSLCQQLLFSDN